MHAAGQRAGTPRGLLTAAARGVHTPREVSAPAHGWAAQYQPRGPTDATHHPSQVLLPCSDITAIMGEIANIPSPCKNNVEGVLLGNGDDYFHALLLATGVNKPIYSSGARRLRRLR